MVTNCWTQTQSTCPTQNPEKKSSAISQEIQLYPEELAEKYTDIVSSRATCTVTIGDGDFPDQNKLREKEKETPGNSNQTVFCANKCPK